MKSRPKRPLKIANLLEIVQECIKTGRYRSCLHLEQREIERGITRREVLYVLQYGVHEKNKDVFDEGYQSWHYAIWGKTLDERTLRVIVTFEEATMLIIITTFEIGK